MTRQINASGHYGNSQFTVSSEALEAKYTTIQEAVTEASTVNGTVFIFPGTYTESITWPENILVEASSNGKETFNVEIIGNQTFDGNGNLSLKNIRFITTNGNTWTQSASSGNGILELQSCKIDSLAGKGIVIGTTGVNTSTLYLEDSEILSSLQAIDALDNSTLHIEKSNLSTSTDNINTIDLSGETSLSISLSNINTSRIGEGCCVRLNGASASVDSVNNRYNAGNTNNAAAFRFITAGGSVRSIKDEMSITGGDYWINSAGFFGTLFHSSTIISEGTTSLIDPKILETLGEMLASPHPVRWNDRGGSDTVSPNTGSVSMAAITLTLPASPSNGDICEFILGASLNLNVTANTGHTIQVGNLKSAVSGTISTDILGNSIKLVYNSTLTSWLATSLTGNWVI